MLTGRLNGGNHRAGPEGNEGFGFGEP
jgi:hypothetical protein